MDSLQNEQLDYEDIDIEELREQLQNSTDIYEQADILQELYRARYCISCVGWCSFKNLSVWLMKNFLEIDVIKNEWKSKLGKRYFYVKRAIRKNSPDRTRNSTH